MKCKTPDLFLKLLTAGKKIQFVPGKRLVMCGYRYHTKPVHSFENFLGTIYHSQVHRRMFFVPCFTKGMEGSRIFVRNTAA